MTLRDRRASRMAIACRCGVLILGLGVTSAPAQFVTYTDQAAFLAAIPSGSTTTTTTFDSLTSGTTVANGTAIDGITYTFNPAVAGDQLQITNRFATPSSPNSLGTDVTGNFNQITGGSDIIDLAFAHPSNAFGLFFTTADAVFAGDLVLTTSAGSASNSATASQTFNDGGKAYFVGFTSSTTVSSVQVAYGSGTPAGSFFYTIDNVTRSEPAAVPEPGSLALTGGAALVAGGLALRQKRRRSIDPAA